MSISCTKELKKKFECYVTYARLQARKLTALNFNSHPEGCKIKECQRLS